MIDVKKVKSGEYVIVTAPFHDYGKVGTIFRVIDGNIPNENTACVGYLISDKTGNVEGEYTYKIPGDKVDPLPRADLAKILEKQLKKKQAAVDAAQKDADILKQRINNLKEYYTQDQEFSDFLREVFGFIPG